MDQYRCFIDNQWVDSSSGQRFSVADPATGEIWAEMPDCTIEDAQAALESATRPHRMFRMCLNSAKEYRMLMRVVLKEDDRP